MLAVRHKRRAACFYGIPHNQPKRFQMYCDFNGFVTEL